MGRGSHGGIRELAVGLVLTALVAAGCADSGSAVPGADRTGSPAGAEGPEDGRGSWRVMAEAPILPAGGMAAVWTGEKLVVWGGLAAGETEPTGAGAAYDPAADRWEELPEAPIAPRFGATAVWTGREVLVWGGQARPTGQGGAAGHDGGPTGQGGGVGERRGTLADGAAYDPATRRWRVVPAAPLGPRTAHEAVWTGREMVVWGGFAECCPIDSVIHDPAAAAYDPAADRWRLLARVPPPWSGDDGSAVTVADGERPLVWREGRLAVYDPAADRWDEIPGAPPPVPPAPGETVIYSTADPFAVGVVADGEFFVWSGPVGRLDGVAYRPVQPAEPGGPAPVEPADDGRPAPTTAPDTAAVWRRTARLDAQFGGTMTAGGPGRIYAAAGQAARILEYRIDEDRWDPLPAPPVRTRSDAVLVWTGTELIWWGGAGDEGPEGDGAIWHCC